MPLSPLRALTGAVLAGAVAGTLLVAPSASYAAAPVAQDRTQARAAVAKPAVGSCHAVSPREVAKVSDPDPAVDCAKPHTSRTFAVPSVPAGVDMTDNDALGKIVTRQCGPAYDKAVSRSLRKRLLAVYFYFWYAPTKQQIDDGARWVRCDLGLSGGSSLVPLPAAKTPALGTAPFSNKEARCYSGRAGGFQSLSCSRPHQYRARSVYAMSGRAFPSQAQQQRTAERRCKPVAGQRWAVFGPTKEQWNTGFKLFVCNSITKR